MKRGGIKGILSTLTRKFIQAKIANSTAPTGPLITAYSRTGAGYIKAIVLSASNATNSCNLKITVDGVVILPDSAVGLNVTLPLQMEYFSSVLVEHKANTGTSHVTVIHQEY